MSLLHVFSQKSIFLRCCHWHAIPSLVPFSVSISSSHSFMPTGKKVMELSRRHLEGISKDGRSMGKGTSHEGCLNCLNLTFALSLTSHTSGNYQQELLGVGKPNPVSGTNTADIRKFL